MMGRQTVDQSQLFYLFNLEGRIPARHLLRRINPTVTRILADLRERLEPFYSEIGPAFDRPRAHDPDADRRLLLRHPFERRPVRGDRASPCLSLVLSASISTTRSPTTRRSRSIVTVAFARATPFGLCSRRWCGRA